MQHQPSAAFAHEALLPIRIVLKLVFFAALGAFVIASQSLALLIAVALGFVLTLAIQERVHRLDAKHTDQAPNPVGLHVSDGGVFPGSKAENRVRITHPRVIDGGSLERLRHRTTNDRSRLQ